MKRIVTGTSMLLLVVATEVAARDTPANVPALGFRIQDGNLFVRMTFSQPPGTTFEAWCYESEVTPVGEPRRKADGALILLHRSTKNKGLLIETAVTPSSGRVSFVARASVDRKVAPTAKVPPYLPYLNLCFQEAKAAAFVDPGEPFPKFIARHFIFAKKGRTSVLDIVRRKVPGIPEDDPRNNPPWVQIYTPAWRPPPKTEACSWAGYSPDRYVLPIIGTVSRDGKWLVALANNGNCGQGDGLCNAWHHCLHSNPVWWPENAPNGTDKRWHINVYVMKNASEMLVQRVERDFPGVRQLRRVTVP